MADPTAAAARTWVIGDIHGWKDVLDRLLHRLEREGLDYDRDRLWLVGDLVNRGPDSLGVLRWARDLEARMGDRFVTVLGNHDLHLLAAAAGRREPTDDLWPVLEADDADDLLAWLRRRPFAHRDKIGVEGEGDGDAKAAPVLLAPVLLVHAGLWPAWSGEDAIAWARKTETFLQGRRGDALLPGDPPTHEEPPDAELVHALEAFVSLRTLDARAAPCRHKGPPEDAPPGCWPWFDASPRAWRDHRVIFGHWAALGRHRDRRPDGTGVEGLDSGVAWGGELTALRLDDGAEWSESSPGRD